MAEFKIDGRMTVRTLKESFKNEFGGTLRVYNGRELADDTATLASIRKIEDVKVGEYICRASRTVGTFEQEMMKEFGIKVQVASPDNWVLALDGITLANIKNIKDKATTADMEVLVSYKRSPKAEGVETEAVATTTTATVNVDDISPKDGYWFLYLPFSECGDTYEFITQKRLDEIICKEDMHMQISCAVSDVANGEVVAHDTCYAIVKDGVYVEVTGRDSYWDDDSMVYVIIEHKLVYEELVGAYTEY